MRVLQVHNRYREPGGEDAVVSAEAALLGSAGHDVVQECVDNPVSAAGAVAKLGLAPWNPIARRSARELVERVRPDVVHVHNTWFALTPATIAGLAEAGAPVVWTLHNYRFVCANALLYRDGGTCQDCVGGSPWPGVRHRCYRGSAVASMAGALTILSNRARTRQGDVARFIVLNDFARAILIRGGLPADRIVVKPNFVPAQRERPAPIDQSRTLLFVGRLSQEKGVHVALEAWRRAGLAGWELVIMGDGPQRAELEKGPPPGVRFMGRQTPDAVGEMMLRSRALLLPSLWYEGEPMVLMEALACGLPVVASAHGGIGETARTLSEDQAVAPGDCAAWAEALRAVASWSSAEATARSNRARDLHAQLYSPEVALTNLLGVYQSVIGVN